MAEVEVVASAHSVEGARSLRVGDVFLKIDADQTRTDVEVAATALAPIPDPGRSCGGQPRPPRAQPPSRDWHRPPRGAVNRFGSGVVPRPVRLHGIPACLAAATGGPVGASASWHGASRASSHWLVANNVSSTPEVVTRNRPGRRGAALGRGRRCSIHGDPLQIEAHVFVDDDVVSRRHRLVRGFLGRRAVRPCHSRSHTRSALATSSPATASTSTSTRSAAWWSWRSLVVVRWLVEHGFEPARGDRRPRSPLPEIPRRREGRAALAAAEPDRRCDLSGDAAEGTRGDRRDAWLT